MLLGFGIIIAMLLVLTAISWLEIVSIGTNMTNTVNQSVMMNRVKDLGGHSSTTCIWTGGDSSRRPILRKKN